MLIISPLHSINESFLCLVPSHIHAIMRSSLCAGRLQSLCRTNSFNRWWRFSWFSKAQWSSRDSTSRHFASLHGL